MTKTISLPVIFPQEESRCVAIFWIHTALLVITYILFSIGVPESFEDSDIRIFIAFVVPIFGYMASHTSRGNSFGSLKFLVPVIASVVCIRTFQKSTFVAEIWVVLAGLAGIFLVAIVLDRMIKKDIRIHISMSMPSFKIRSF